MDNITKVSIKRLSKAAGIKTISEDCYDVIREIIQNKLNEIVTVSSKIMTEGNSKTLSQSHIINGLELMGEYITQSSELNT